MLGSNQTGGKGMTLEQFQVPHFQPLAQEYIHDPPPRPQLQVLHKDHENTRKCKPWSITHSAYSDFLRHGPRKNKEAVTGAKWVMGEGP